MDASRTPDDDYLGELAQATAVAVQQCHVRLVTAESCTGGWIARVLTDIPGSSEWFDGGVVAYGYEAKEVLLGVQPQTLEQHGAVSQEAATEMVSGALARLGAGVAVAVTGVAGPGGGTVEKPVGTVWLAWKKRGGYARTELCHFEGDRDAVRRRSVARALLGIQKILTK